MPARAAAPPEDDADTTASNGEIGDPEQSEATEAASPSDRETARQLAQDGRELYWKGEYAAAIRAFESAYALVPDPNLLFNISAAHEKLGDYDSALAQLDRYAAAAPDSEVASIEAKRRELEQARTDAATRPAEIEGPGPRPATPEGPAPSDGAAGVDDDADAANEARPLPPIMGPAGFSLAGVTLVSLGVGIGFGVSAGRLSNRGDEACQTTGNSLRCPVGAENELMKASRHAVVADVGFAVAAAAGIATLTLVGVRLARRKRTNGREPSAARVRWTGRALAF